MAKELHIKIDKQIGGLFISADGWLEVGYSAQEFEYALSEMPNPKKLVIHANSPGGDGFIAQKIFNRLQELKEQGTTVKVINESIAFSAMTFIAMAASPGELIAYEATEWSVHKPMVAPDDYMNADELRKAADNLDSFEDILVSAYVARTGKTEKEVKDALRADVIINAKQAKEQGWIDDYIPIKQEQPQEKELKVMAFKPVAYFTKKQIQEEMITAEQEESIANRVFNSIKSFLNFTPTPQPEPVQDPVTEPVQEPKPVQPEPATEPQPDPKDERIKELEARVKELESKDTEIQNLKTEITNLKNFVPGSGDNSPKPEQQFANYGRQKENKSPFDTMAENAKRIKK